MNALLSHAETSHQPSKLGSPDDILQQAERIIEQRFSQRQIFSTSHETRQYVVFKLALLEHEVFSILLLDNQHRLLGYEQLFRGSLREVSVYPREVVKLSLRYNAAALILVHNHPSGDTEPSTADCHITQRLKAALDLIDVRVLDHVIVAGNQTTSLAERGLL
ncbi:RadC family protein [Serratia oryzae]|uniref:MPN domain-containing protein n=1 Tax=Serratia oryzae TaxID=2034155 RepID=A0A1S8CDT7_9GAMM|nr:DNA repair protein RadC [Serratia oryzae]OMQ18781.1 hypothetical protein BMI79_21810 [Serratia oryzae]VXD08385.1 conserved hypothetical protein [Enterobacterales bacterium 8AC]